MTTPVQPATISAPKTGNPVGLASLIVGIIAFIFGVVPFLSFIAWVPALVAIGLAIGGLVVKNRKRLTAWLGLVLGILAIIIGIIVSIASVAGVASSISDSIDESEADADVPISLVYEVSSDAPTAGNITYSSFGTESDGMQQASDAALPWTVTEEVRTGGDFEFNAYSLSAQSSDVSTTITCRITLDGQVISENTSTGPYSIAMCNGSSTDLEK
jgi:hypothetical protein